MKSRPTIPSRTAIVTGGNAGLGYQAAKNIAGFGEGWRVVVAGRREEKAAEAARRIAAETGNARVEAMKLDLASLSSVRSFAATFASRRDGLAPLRAVVCNAGLQAVSGTTHTEDGFEATFGVNHLGHYLLVNLLLEEVVAPARIVFVSSGTHDPKQRTGMPEPRYRGAEALARPERYPDPAEDGEGPGTVGRRRYTTSKLSNIYAAYELARRLEDEGFGTEEASVTANAFDPGGMPGTGLTRDYPGPVRFALNRLLPPIVPLLRTFGANVNTAEASGKALARLVTDPSLEGVSGRYFEGEEEARSSDLSYDRENAAELWETSAELVGLGPEEAPPRAAAHTPKT